MNETIKNLVAIINNNGVHSALYRWQETVTNNYAHPVYTNATTMTGKANTSQNFRNIKQASKVVKRESSTILAKDDARSLIEAAQSTGMVDRVERHENGNWVIWVK